MPLKYQSESLPFSINFGDDVLVEVAAVQLKKYRFRKWALFCACVRADWYLFFKGMWKGECLFKAQDKSGRVIIVGTVTGSMLDKEGGLNFRRVFWCEKK